MKFFDEARIEVIAGNSSGGPAAGLGTPSHLAAELLKQSARIDLLIIQYKGTGSTLNDLIGGQVALSFGTLAGLAPFAKSGRVRALAVSGSKRAASMPEVPTAAETLPGFDVLTWYGLFAPVATPRAVAPRYRQPRHRWNPRARSRAVIPWLVKGRPTPGAARPT